MTKDDLDPLGYARELKHAHLAGADQYVAMREEAATRLGQETETCLALEAAALANADRVQAIIDILEKAGANE